MSDYTAEMRENSGAVERPEPVTRWAFVVPVEPVAKGRPRTGRGKDGSVRVYTPGKTRTFEGVVAMVAARAMPRGVLDGPLRVDILAVLPRPSRLWRKKDPAGLVWAPSRPDADNIRKGVLDGMAACWRDDAQVCAGDTRKVYAEKAGRPRVEVVVSRLWPGEVLP